MDKIRILGNYEDYGNVMLAFKSFISTLVWESTDIEEGVHEDEVNNTIAKYCNTKGDEIIAKLNNDIKEFVKSLASRYEVHCYEIDANGNAIEETAKHFETDNEVLALKKGAEFYRHAKCPQVNIYDNKENKYIAEWN
jgi:hypothetical protein